jgi:hypothetical protein
LENAPELVATGVPRLAETTVQPGKPRNPFDLKGNPLP